MEAEHGLRGWPLNRTCRQRCERWWPIRCTGASTRRDSRAGARASSAHRLTERAVGREPVTDLQSGTTGRRPPHDHRLPRAPRVPAGGVHRPRRTPSGSAYRGRRSAPARSSLERRKSWAWRRSRRAGGLTFLAGAPRGPSAARGAQRGYGRPCYDVRPEDRRAPRTRNDIQRKGTAPHPRTEPGARQDRTDGGGHSIAP